MLSPNCKTHLLLKKKEGFQGQKAIVIPRKILTMQCSGNPVIGSMYITDIGYYPKAKFHFRERPQGADQHIFIHCIEGSGTVTIQKNEFDIHAGDFFVVPSKTAHLYAANEKNPWTIYWMHFKGAISDAVVSLIETRSNGYKGHIYHNETLIRLFNEMYGQLEKGYRGDHLLYANMCLWHYFAGVIFNFQQGKQGLIHQDVTDTAINFMHEKVDKVLSLQKIASSANLSVSHFSFLFKNKTGFTPIEYFNHLKVQKACQYLLFTNLRIKEIALELGIEDEFYFSRMFSKIMGLSPNVYRKKKIH